MPDDDGERRLRKLAVEHAETRWLAFRLDDDVKEVRDELRVVQGVQSEHAARCAAASGARRVPGTDRPARQLIRPSVPKRRAPTSGLLLPCPRMVNMIGADRRVGRFRGLFPMTCGQ